MEPIQHTAHLRRKKNSAKVNLTVSIVIHGLLFAAGAYWAAHEGVLGKTLQNLSVGILAKEKKAEAAKKIEAKPAEQKVEQLKVEQKAVAAQARIAPPPPAAINLPESVAPPPVVLGDTFFSKDEITSGDPVVHYKSLVESALKAKWDRPTDVSDADFKAEVELALDRSGKIAGYDWKKGSGNARWDSSVRKAVESMKAMSRPLPQGFPDKFVVRFDVQPDTLASVQ